MSDTENPIETPPETPEVPPVDPFLGHTKQIVMDRIVSHMNGVGASIIQKYPMAEVQSWPLQKPEAEALLALVEPTIEEAVTAAPFLLLVTQAHYGPEADANVRLGQLVQKATEVKANADTWAALSAFVNGLRARASDRIDAATTVDEVFTIESETQSELGTFRNLHGV